jgi:dTDP-4-amino-4,6-dideoxygalactose transaminase
MIDHKEHYLKIPRLLGQQWGTTPIPDCLAAMKYITNSSQVVDGPEIQKYEQLFARQVGVRYAYSFSSGRVALFALLRSINLREGEEVILQVPTHIVVANAIRYAGGIPVYVDCEINTFNMNLDLIKKKITPKTRVLLIQHTFGIPANMDTAIDLARKYKLVLIEDCVHALGAEYKGRQIGSMGSGAFFSTEETKIISSTMGGMAVTNEPDIAESLRNIQAQCSIYCQALPVETGDVPYFHPPIYPSIHSTVLHVFTPISCCPSGAWRNRFRRNPGDTPPQLPAPHEQWSGCRSHTPIK